MNFGNHNPTGDRMTTFGEQYLFKFDNGYGASVVRNQYSYGGGQGLWELGVLDGKDRLTYDTPITNDVLGYLTEQDVADALDQIAALATHGSIA